MNLVASHPDEIDTELRLPVECWNTARRKRLVYSGRHAQRPLSKVKIPTIFAAVHLEYFARNWCMVSTSRSNCRIWRVLAKDTKNVRSGQQANYTKGQGPGTLVAIYHRRITNEGELCVLSHISAFWFSGTNQANADCFLVLRLAWDTRRRVAAGRIEEIESNGVLRGEHPSWREHFLCLIRPVCCCDMLFANRARMRDVCIIVL